MAANFGVIQFPKPFSKKNRYICLVSIYSKVKITDSNNTSMTSNFAAFHPIPLATYNISFKLVQAFHTVSKDILYNTPQYFVGAGLL